MTRSILLPLVAGFLILAACQPQVTTDDQKALDSPNLNSSQNLLTQFSVADFAPFQWMNSPSGVELEGHVLHISVTKGTDYFIDPESRESTATAPYLYQEMEGDFEAIALVEPDFSAQWNAVSLLMYIDSTHWIKMAFENSDATGKSIVTVVTRTVSDDANGAVLQNQERIWLKMIRKGNLYAMHWSADGETYQMGRLCRMPAANPVKIGIEAQCPVGDQADHTVHYLSVAKKTVKDLRKGI